jgi:murein DD-endopeptidase MepM/ murein hydrolase activator NlpD
MFPLKERKLIRGFQAHIKAGLGSAADYVADKDTLYAPFSGRIETYWGKEGGNWSRQLCENGDRIEFGHLQSYIKKNGMVKEGDPIAITGNTGSLTTGPHLHIQIFNKQGKRLDPETYLWETSMPQIITQAKGAERRIVIRTANKVEWESLCKVFGKDPSQIDETV